MTRVLLDGLHQKANGYWMVDKIIGGRRVRASTKTKNANLAYERYLAIIHAKKGAKPPTIGRARDHAGWQRYVLGLGKSSWLGIAFGKSRAGAKVRGLPHSLTFDQAQQIAIRSGGRCEVSGIRFSRRTREGWFAPPFAPSFDRIDCRLGYSFDNVRLVGIAVNLALGTWGEDVLTRIARGIAAATVCPEFGTIG